MKSMIKNRLLLVTAICFLFAGTSCQYDEIVDIPYPESLVYLPIAVNGSISPDGIYTIEEGASTAWVSPTPGQPMKYTVRNADNAFVIPLGIYRSGTGKTIKGSVNVSVMLNTDTVQTLIDNGATVIVIEHDLDVIKNADYIVDMGPEGGEAGGEIIFTGTPKDLKNCKTSKTAKFL